MLGSARRCILRRTITTIIAAIALTFASSSSAHAPRACTASMPLERLEGCQERNLAHYRGAVRVLEERGREVGELGRVERRELRFHRAASRWTLRELGDTRARIAASRTVLAIVRATAASLGVVGYSWDCLAALISRENANPPERWNPQRWNSDDAPPLSRGSGAYGLGQALPASKMSAFGADYMTNPATQTRWMIAYSEGRYGSVCGADAFQRAHRWY